jgi:Outer membrane protein beta-barrel domain
MKLIIASISFLFFVTDGIAQVAALPLNDFSNDPFAAESPFFARKTKKTKPLFKAMPSFGASSLPGESESYSGSLPHAGIGVLSTVGMLSDKVELVTGVRYTAEGSKYTVSEYVPGGMEKEVENKVRLNYLRIPVFTRINAGSKIYFDAGLQPGLLLSAKDKYEGGTNDIKEDYNGFDLGLLFGAGYMFTEKIAASLNFNPGITNINKKGGFNDDKKDRNSSIFLGLQYTF